MKTQTALSLIAVLLLSACNTPSAPQDVPALIVDPTENSRAELRLVVSRALNGIEVTLADDALTQTSLLTVERRPIRDLQGRLLEGRKLGMPHRFRLVKNGSDCVLVEIPDARRWVLGQTSCIAE